MNTKIIDNPLVSIKHIADYLDLERGDIVFLSSDIKRVVFNEYNKTGDMPDVNLLIDGFIQKIGVEGTLILPTYNWNFCHGTPFDWNKTKGLTGSLGNVCLSRHDFKRTKHPIYSYVVWGKHKEKLCKIDYVSSFGRNSLFGFMDRHHAKHVMIDVDFNHAYTFLHYAEEKVSNICYRFIKKFTGDYIDENKHCCKKTYTMLVRNLLMDVKVDMTQFEKDMFQKNLAHKIIVNDVPYIIVPDVNKTIPFLEDDIRNNYSRKVCTYKGLKENFE